MMTYFVPLRMGTKKSLADPLQPSTCCVGSGMRNHFKVCGADIQSWDHGELFVNLFIPFKLSIGKSRE
jgi:DUF1680 family protein